MDSLKSYPNHEKWKRMNQVKEEEQRGKKISGKYNEIHRLYDLLHLTFHSVAPVFKLIMCIFV